MGIARMVNKYYGKDEKSKERFVERLKDFHLHLPTGIRIEGEWESLISNLQVTRKITGVEPLCHGWRLRNDNYAASIVDLIMV
ncbi:MAG: hypothetical protein R2784_05240 [Saprospiraceae bacterium]